MATTDRPWWAAYEPVGPWRRPRYSDKEARCCECATKLAIDEFAWCADREHEPGKAHTVYACADQCRDEADKRLFEAGDN